MGRFSSKNIRTLQRRITSWYGTYQRQLQWRTTTDPYEILLSEVMLQQTQVARVQEKLPIFLKRFPTLKRLASSTKADVIQAWEGMGYNNRAIRLREMAKGIMLKHDGEIPRDPQALQQLPGIGPYSAHAAACFAYRKQVPVVDTNIRRVLSRLLWRMKAISDLRSDKDIWKTAGEILPADAYTWNQALMDLGAVLCTARKPLCNLCPVEKSCASRHLGHINLSRARQRAMRKPEPSYRGMPQRIWRGKIIQVLRTLNGKGSTTLRELGVAVKDNFRKDETGWILSVIGRLKADGLVQTQTTSKTIRIMLARE